jgi:MFS transporter, DHA1 family, inner membrane transport protein
MFANTSINRLYIHSGLLAFSENVGGVFIYVYLLASGLSGPAVFCTIAAVTLTRYLVRPVVIPLGIRFGTRRILMLGATVEAFGYLALVCVHGLGPGLCSTSRWAR